MGMSCLLCLTMLTVAGSEELRSLSFYPPFKSFNARGDRTVPSWTLTGSALVKQSFSRITADSVDESGSMYSRLTSQLSEQGAGQFSAVLTFRVSGDDEKHHGKYLAFVVGTPEHVRRSGPTFGFPENFVGVGVAITSKAPADMSEPSTDTRAMGPRQFVSFFANNGTRSTNDVRVLANSCASTVRYGQKRDDFNFLRSSRFRLGFYEGEVILEVDARNIGVWRKCISTMVPDMPQGWLDRVGVAISSETGREVANNHDIMSLEFYSQRSQAFDSNVVDGTSVKEGVEAEDAVKARTEKLAAIHAHLEHEFDSVERILKDSLAKLSLMNDDLEERLAIAEKKVNKDAFEFLNTNVKAIEERVKMNAVPALDSRLNGVKTDFHEEMDTTMYKMLSDNRGWKLPFVVAFLFLGAMVAFAVKQYRKLLKANYLGNYR